ncbi:MAG: DUF1700 domain-containing protein [Chloroflexota bacterium]
MTDPNLLAQRYLQIFRANLTRLPERERDELTAEIQSHITEALNSGQSIADVLTRLGPADRLAKAYMVEQLLDPATPGSRIGRFLAVTGIVASMSLSAIIIIPTLGGLAIGLGVGGIAAIIAGIAASAVPWTIHLPFTMPLAAAQSLAVFIGVVLTALGALSTWGLVAYIKFIVGATRRALSR